ncbi:hypothetical protein TUMSATVNIG1_59040 (plasmid) [Vibrio nigripulchritudo]|uniref:hypothetical protein n=1 Tax=Vibrio nigripulchritudo TaxID=28173 RepID=UPI00190B6EA1|nr:hypothetical protein [Vibrio nigripulchritudo]BCL73919.1 hypothetical protein VNTUMSATTG_58560 [Vibrio nigripulchritudo]BDU35295.1 hypothetical protein TUMSATVNIG1_59040 [Vibrio nigripulchritudo]
MFPHDYTMYTQNAKEYLINPEQRAYVKAQRSSSSSVWSAFIAGLLLGCLAGIFFF